MKSDEKLFLSELIKHHGFLPYHQAHKQGDWLLADKIGLQLNIPIKRIYHLLRRWDSKGWWESGVSERSGWFTPEGIEEIKKLI